MAVLKGRQQRLLNMMIQGNTDKDLICIWGGKISFFIMWIFN